MLFDDRMTLYHGSAELIKKPEPGREDPYKDFGPGFYCTESRELAKEWACRDGRNGYALGYRLNAEGLRVLRLGETPLGVLNWLALLLRHRAFSAKDEACYNAAEAVKDRVAPELKGVDLIVGPRADDPAFSFAQAFLDGELSLEKLTAALRLDEGGEQIVLVSKAAFARLAFLDSEEAKGEQYDPIRRARDFLLRARYAETVEKDAASGLGLLALVEGGVKADDPRLQ